MIIFYSCLLSGLRMRDYIDSVREAQRRPGVGGRPLSPGHTRVDIALVQPRLLNNRRKGAGVAGVGAGWMTVPACADSGTAAGVRGDVENDVVRASRIPGNTGDVQHV